MADNIDITPGSGKTVLTDDCTTGHAQIIKLAYSADGTATLITADANGLEVQLGTEIPAGTNNIGDVDVLTVPADPFGANADAASATGSISAKLRFIAATGIPVTGSVAVTNGGTFLTQVDGAALTALQLIDDSIFADDAAFTVGSSKVTAVGIQGVAYGSNPDAADALDAVIPIANRHRVPFIIGGHPNIQTFRTTFTSAQTNVALLSVSTGTKIVLTRITVTMDNASTVFPTILIGFGTSTTPTTTALAEHGGLPAGGGFTIGDGSGIIGVGADDADLRITTTGTATGNGVSVTGSYFTIES